MEAALEFMSQYGYWFLFVWVALDQAGVPIPGVPVLIGVGALAGVGDLSLPIAIAVSTAGSLIGDLIWYEAGRRRGAAVLRTLCRISLEPDSCVRKTEDTFERYGASSLIVAKLIPGYQTLGVALAGMSPMSVFRFLAFDTAGAAVWSALFIGIGYLLHDQIERGAELAANFGFATGVVVGGGLVAWVAWKYLNRRRFIQSLRMAQIGPDELKALIDGESMVEILDLRSRLEIEASSESIPGARVVSIEEIDDHHEGIPRDADIVLFCT